MIEPNIDNPYEVGYFAYHPDPECREECPYHLHDPKREIWFKGMNDAHNDYDVRNFDDGSEQEEWD